MMDELYLAQEDGGLPTTLAAGSAPGEAASPSSACGSEAAYIQRDNATALIWFQMSPQTR